MYKEEHFEGGHKTRRRCLGGVDFKVSTGISFPLSQNIEDGPVGPAGIQVPSRDFLEVTRPPLAVSPTVTKDYPGNL